MGEGRPEGFSEEVMFEPRPEGEERAGLGKRLAIASAKALRQGRKQHVLRTERGRSDGAWRSRGKTVRDETWRC